MLCINETAKSILAQQCRNTALLRKSCRQFSNSQRHGIYFWTHTWPIKNLREYVFLNFLSLKLYVLFSPSTYPWKCKFLKKLYKIIFFSTWVWSSLNSSFTLQSSNSISTWAQSMVNGHGAVSDWDVICWGAKETGNDLAFIQISHYSINKPF